MQHITKQILLIIGASLFGLLLYYGVREALMLSGIPVTKENIRYGVIIIVLTIGLYLAFKK